MACKPHSVRQGGLPGWSSVWAGALPPWLGAAYPGLEGCGPHPGGARPPLPLLGLAPGGGCLAAPVTRRAGGLLPHLFTLARTCAAAQAAGGLFLWPYPRGYPLPGVTRRHALWSADFPRQPLRLPRPPGHPKPSSLILRLLGKVVNHHRHEESAQRKWPSGPAISPRALALQAAWRWRFPLAARWLK